MRLACLLWLPRFPTGWLQSMLQANPGLPRDALYPAQSVVSLLRMVPRVLLRPV